MLSFWTDNRAAILSHRWCHQLVLFLYDPVERPLDLDELMDALPADQARLAEDVLEHHQNGDDEAASFELLASAMAVATAASGKIGSRPPLLTALREAATFLR